MSAVIGFVLAACGVICVIAVTVLLVLVTIDALVNGL
jgi:hypothetical protein